MRQELIGMAWHQSEHMQTICTSLQTDNYTNNTLITQLNFICEVLKIWLSHESKHY